MRLFYLLTLSLFVCSLGAAQPVYVDLADLFDTDVVVEPGGAGLTDPLDEEDGWIDGASLSKSYNSELPTFTQDGSTSFFFAPLDASGLDALALNGQSIAAPVRHYESLDLALLSAPGSFGYPFDRIELRYMDGSSDSYRWGPVAGWFASPTAFDNTRYSYTDSSSVETIASFPTNFSDEELIYLLQERGNGNSGGTRFVDGTGFVLYVFEDLPLDMESAKLGVTVGNNFVVSAAAYYFNPEDPVEVESYTVLANSMELYDGFEHRALGNLKLYEFDVSPFLAEQTGELYVLLTDATPGNGWGPYIQNISLYTGEYLTFEETLEPVVDTSEANVYAMFQTNGGEDESPYLYDNSGSGPSNRDHRFADGAGSITYRFDLPDDVTDAQLTVDMANNFVVSLGGPTGVVRYAQMSPGTADESNYLIDEGGSILGGNYRFADAAAYMVYQFDLPDDLTSAVAQINVGNQFIIEVAGGTDSAFEIEYDWVFDSGEETRDNSNLDVYEVSLDPYLQNNPENIVQIRLSDGIPADGWGPYLTGIAIVNQSGTDEDPFTEVLSSMDLFGDDIHTEYNKDYYTIDLSQVLQSDNPGKEVFVKFTDGSTGDGWGPGIFWMAVYSGSIDIQTDTLVFNDLKATSGEPVNYGLGLLSRRFPVDSSKNLSEIVFPTQPEIESDVVYLLGATLNAVDNAVSDWMMF